MLFLFFLFALLVHARVPITRQDDAFFGVIIGILTCVDQNN